MKSRFHLIKRLLAIFGCVAGLVLLVAAVFWGNPAYRSEQEVKEALSLYQKAGLPVGRNEIFQSAEPDHVSPILEELGNIRKDPGIHALFRKGKPYSDEVGYSVQYFTQIHLKGMYDPMRRYDYPREKLAHIHRFCEDPRTQKAFSLLREAAQHGYRNGLKDGDFYGAWLPGGQDNGRDYLKYLLIDQSRIASEDSSKNHEIFQTLLLILKMENLLVQGYTYTHYLERRDHCVQAFRDWMRFDSAYGTPADSIDDLSHCLDLRKEEEIWLKCHDRERIFGKGYTQQYYDDLSKMRAYSWKSSLSEDIPYLLRKPFERIRTNQDYSFFLREVLATRGVTPRHFQSAREKDRIFKERNENGGTLFMPPYYGLYIKSHHELMMWHEILMTGLAINSYADAYGLLPKSLDDLVPGYLPSVPQDRFPIESPGSLRYAVHGDVFELSSSFGEISFQGRRTSP